MAVDYLQFFESRGWTRNQAAGIVGNLYGESAFNPTAIGDGGAAYGLAQWHPDRQANFANVFGKPIQQASVTEQLAFVDWELRNTELRAGNMLRGASTVEDATRVVTKYYERPADVLGEANKRIDFAKKALSGALDGLKGAARGAIESYVPGGSAILGLTDGIGLTSECGWICQIKEWIKGSGFFPRLALAILAFIIILSAFLMMRGNLVLSQSLGRVAKGATKL